MALRTSFKDILRLEIQLDSDDNRDVEIERATFNYLY